MALKIKVKTKPVKLDSLPKVVADELEQLTGKTIQVPVAPEPGDDLSRDEVDEIQIGRVELLMVKGIRTKRTLMTLLELKDHRQMDRYISRVHTRWEMFGTTQDHARHRGEGLARLDLVESELWAKAQKVEDVAKVTNLMATILQVQKQRTEMLGLTPKVIERIGAADTDAITFSQRASSHERLALIAARMLRIIEDRTRPMIEGVVSDETGV